MKHFLFVIAFAASAFAFTGASAQSAPQTVIGSAGDFATFATGSMTWTIGEVMTETFSATGNFFTQGFNQPDTMYLTVISEPVEQTINVFPNPVVEHLVVDLSKTSGAHIIEIFDMQGNLLKQEPVPASQLRVDLPFREYANGMYLLNVTNTSTHGKNSYKINKAQ